LGGGGIGEPGFGSGYSLIVDTNTKSGEGNDKGGKGKIFGKRFILKLGRELPA